MKTSYNWLKDYVNIKLSPEELAHKLTMAGLEVTSIEKMGDDAIMEFEITPNRPDCLSVIGIAREAATVTGKKLKTKKSKLKSQDLKIKPQVEIRDKDLCPRYTARIIEGVKVGPSPQWLVDRLEGMGLRPVNNVVDITNFCLFELGQPLHAFDYDKIKGRKIIVRRAKEGEKIVTIDGEQRVLSKDMLIIADTERAVAIGGVMGSLNSEVTDSTRNVLLESAYFNPVSVRRTSRRLGLISESSYRFERSVDPGGITPASDRAASLIAELCGGKIGPIKDVGKSDPKERKISLRTSRLNAILGLEVLQSIIEKILTSLQLKVKSSAKDKLSIGVPSFRQDLKSEIDLIEEVARIYGYDRFPSTMPTTTMVDHHTQGCEFERVVNNLLRETLVSFEGINEIITYGLISRKALEGIDVDPEKTVSIKNPLGLEQEIMRPTLMPGLLNTISRNLNNRQKDQKLFELGKAYFKAKGAFKEEDRLIIGLTGMASAGWLGRKKVNILYLKGIIESLFDKLEIDLSVDIGKIFPVLERRVPLKVGSVEIGFLEEVSKKLLSAFDIKTEVFICEIEVPKITPFIKLKMEKRFSEITKYPSATRDLSIIVDKIVLSEKVASIIKSAGGDLVKKVDLFDQYSGKQIPAGKRGLSYSIEYQAQDRTLTDGEINRLHSEIRNAITRQLGARIR